MKTMPDRPIILHLLLYAFVMVVAAMAATASSSSSSSSASASSSSLASSQQPPATEKPNPKMVRALESRLLGMFGLASRPRPSANALIPDYMMQLYRRQQKLNRESGGGAAVASTVRSFRHRESHRDAEYSPLEFNFLFNVSTTQDGNDNELLKAAELRLFRAAVVLQSSADDGPHHPAKRDVESSQRRHVQRILVYDVLQPQTASSEAILRLIDSRSLDASAAAVAGWETFDVFPAVVRWQREPHANHGLFVRAIADNAGVSAHSPVRLRRSKALDDRTWQKQRPLLVTFSEDASVAAAAAARSRSRRSPGGGKGGGRRSNKPHQYANKADGGGKSCQRHSLYVDFTDVGWNDWIVAPPGYQAYYCHGQCKFPLADHLNTTNHAVVQTLVHSVNAQTVPLACCVPTELSPISMLYLDQYDKVVLKNYQDMVVEGCGCR